MVCVQHGVCILLCIAQYFGVDLPCVNAELAVISIGDAVGPTERVVLPSATRTVANPSTINVKNCLNKHTHINTHTHTSYKWSQTHTHRHHTKGHTLLLILHTHSSSSSTHT